MGSSSSRDRTCSSLPDDILLEIFSYLPLNSIYKFKCLSKVWLSNLSNPDFIIKWFQINNDSLPWLQYYSITDEVDDENPVKFNMAYNDLHSEFMSRNDHLFSFKFLLNKIPFQGNKLLLLGSSNGLVLCLSRISDEQCRYHVFNPLTQTRVTLPLPPRFEMEGPDVAGIFCEYSSSFESCYKVVRIPEFDEPSKKLYLDMFSSDLGVWESFEVSCDENVSWEFSSLDKVVIHNGVLFWIEGRDRMLVYNINQKNKSEGHRCILINLPDEESDDDDAEYINYRSRIWESDSSVYYAKTRWTGSGMTLSVWVLNDASWKILHKDISLDNILAELRSRIGKVEIVQVLGFSLVDQNVVLLGCKYWVWGFNIQTRSFEELCLDKRHVHDAVVMFLPFVLKPMPTVLPPPSWIDTEK